MGHKKEIEEFTNILATALRHKIGGIVNFMEVYASKYSKNYEILLKEAKKILEKTTFNFYEKKEIKEILGKKLYAELASKEFLSDKKFDIMGEEIEKVLKEIGLL
jgi:hypothetical protein